MVHHGGGSWTSDSQINIKGFTVLREGNVRNGIAVAYSGLFGSNYAWCTVQNGVELVPNVVVSNSQSFRNSGRAANKSVKRLEVVLDGVREFVVQMFNASGLTER